jgi:small-conductance mechanosensitive channel
MKALLLILIFLQNQIAQIDSIQKSDSLIRDSVIVTTKVETVRVLVNENLVKPEAIAEKKNYLDELITHSLSSGWKFIFALILLIVVGYINFKLNQIFDKYNLYSKIKNGDLLKAGIQLLIWILAILFIFFVLFKSSKLLILLFIIFSLLILIISLSDLAKNIIGGLLILGGNYFKIGDWIKIGEYSGRVYSKNLRDTQIITEDDSLVRIPNQLFITETFENLNVISKNKQVNFVVEVPPKTEISKLKLSIEEIVALSVYNSINKPVEVIYKGLNSRGNLEFQIKAYVFDAKYESRFKSDVQESISNIFKSVP